jgi:ribosomal protein L35
MPVKPGKCGKQKVRKAASKRIKRTNGGSGKLVIEKVAHRHLLLQKSKGQKAKAANPIDLAKGEAKIANAMLI